MKDLLKIIFIILLLTAISGVTYGISLLKYSEFNLLGWTVICFFIGYKLIPYVLRKIDDFFD